MRPPTMTCEQTSQTPNSNSVASACNHANWLALPFSFELIWPAALTTSKSDSFLAKLPYFRSAKNWFSGC